MIVDPIPRRWPGSTIALIAPGPSLTHADAAALSAACDHVIAVGDAWRLAPWADLVYHADEEWWFVHNGLPDFAGEKWTQDKRKTSDGVPVFATAAGDEFGLSVVRSEFGSDLSFDPAFIRQGGHSGFQAHNLAVLFGGTCLRLLGFDMKGTHFFGQHPRPLDPAPGHAKNIAALTHAASQFAEAGVEVINHTRDTALDCFPRMPLEALDAAA